MPRTSAATQSSPMVDHLSSDLPAERLRIKLAWVMGGADASGGPTLEPVFDFGGQWSWSYASTFAMYLERADLCEILEQRPRDEQQEHDLRFFQEGDCCGFHLVVGYARENRLGMGFGFDERGNLDASSVRVDGAIPEDNWVIGVMWDKEAFYEAIWVGNGASDGVKFRKGNPLLRNPWHGKEISTC